MSAYIQFFIKVDNKFIPIAEYSRSSMLYQVGNEAGAPWEKIRLVNDNFKDYVRTLLKDQIDQIEDYQAGIKHYEELFKTIAEMNNSASEKMEALSDVRIDREEVEDELRHAKDMLADFNFMCRMAEDYNYSFYVGIEVGEPTENDVIE